MKEKSPEQYQRLSALLQEQQRRKENNKARTFIPNGKAEEFIKLVGSDEKFVNMFIGANGTSKCLPLDTPILMADGSYKRLNEVKKGDYVLGHNWDSGIAEPTKVLGTSRAGKKVIYKITFKDGSIVRASAEHSFPIRLRSGRNAVIKKRRLDEVLDRKHKYIGGKIKFIQPKEILFENDSKLPIHPYLLGALIGDGSLSYNGNHGRIGFTNKDKKVISKIKKLVELENCQLKQITDIDYRIVQYARTDKGYGKNVLVDKIKALRLNVKSGDKFIPHIYKTADIKDRKEIIAGLIDTDGSLSSYVSKSEILAKDFIFIIRSLGGYASLQKRTINNSFTKFQDKVYNSVYWKFDYKLPLQIDRKQKIRIMRPVDYSNRFVEKIEKLIKVECGDIWVEHFYHCYLSNDFISTGNTSTAVNIIVNIVFGVQNKWFEHPLFQEWPYIKKGRIISDPTTIKEKIIPELEKWFPVNEAKKIPQANFETAKEGKNYVCKIRTKTGWTIDIMSSEQDTKEFESVDLGFCAIDEPIPKDKFLATIARARMGMIIFWTFTPLTYSAWIKNWMDEQRDTGMADYIEAEMPDNCRLHGVRGFFEHKHIKRIADSYPEDEKEARVFGKFGHLVGRVHKKFSRKIHVIKPFPINVRDFTAYQALDPHPRVADHTLYMAVRKNGQGYIIGELIHEGVDEKAVKRMSERMKAFETSMNMRIETRIIDPSAFNEDEHQKEKSVGKQFFDIGMHFIKGSKDLMGCIKKTDEAFSYQIKKGLMVIHPEIYIFDTCPVTIKQVEEYVWSEWKGTSKDEKQANAKPRDINDHQVENLHRILVHPTPFIPHQLRRSNVIPVGADSDIADHGFDPYAK